MTQPPVRLKYVESDNFSPGGGVTGVNNTKITAKVKNLAFAKDVALHYAQSDGTWTEKALRWQKNFGAYDVFALSDNTFVMTQFVIRYSVEGQTFWDNNDEANYHIDEIRPNTVGGNVILNKATARRGTQAGGGFVVTTSWVEGEIFVKNLSANKRVGLRLSPDGWFKTPELNLDESRPDFIFAVFYNNLDTGEWFWDSNFGQDYTLSKTDFATDE
ncbi:MAG: hypothetical protein HY268_00925 [Deltaproteobacteria bacterium]|nr:hypothetical protein [Deltaproteobacteria bacterium]